MNKHEEARNALFSNTYEIDNSEKLLLDYINQSEQTEKELELYRQFVNGFLIEISLDINKRPFEYLSLKSSPYDIIKILKQIQELRGKNNETF
jgi:hypothetical protein